MNMNAAGAHAVDVMNKSAIAKAAYDLELRKTNDRAKAVEYAVEQARRAMPNYNLGNKARIGTSKGPLGALGAPITQFKHYGLHMYSIMANLAKESMSGPNKAEARKAFAGLLASHAMMAGVLTLIADPLRYIGGAYDALSGAQKPHDYQNDVRGFMADVFGPELGEVLARGAPHALGFDVHRRVGLANLLEIPEMRSFDKAGAAEVLIGAALGASGENLTNIVDGLRKFRDGDVMGGMISAMPRLARDITKAYKLDTTGVTDQRGKVELPAEKISNADVAYQALGFQPSRVSEFREGRAAVQEAQQEAKSEHDRLVQRWLAADAEERQNIRQEINLFNQNPRNLGFRITQGQLLRDLQQRRKQADAPFGLHLPRKGAAALAEAGAFANYQ